MIGLRADDHVHGLFAAQNLSAFGLSDAAGDAEQHVAAFQLLRLLDLADAAQLRIDFLGGLFADVAGVDQDEVGVFQHIGPGIAFRSQMIAHPLRIVDIHLTAIGLDEDFAAWGGFSIYGGVLFHARPLRPFLRH